MRYVSQNGTAYANFELDAVFFVMVLSLISEGVSPKFAQQKNILLLYSPMYQLLQYETCLFLIDRSAEGEVGGVWNDPREFGGDGNVARLIGRGFVSFNGWL